MAKKITKAIIPAAGFGTRFLPQTKAMPKEMMPLVDKPIIQRVVEELVDAGIETIIIVTNSNKRPIEDHFDNNFELEATLERSGKTEELETVRRISDLAEFIYIRQKGPMGNATPILNSQAILDGDPFIMFWGDDFIDAEPSRAKQLIDAFEKYNAPILGTMKARSEEDYKKYGFAGGDQVDDGVIKLTRVAEKPGSRENAPSDMAVISGFIFTPEIFQHLENAKNNLPDGEELVYLSGVQGIIDQGLPVFGVEIKNSVYRDTGNKLEYLKTVVEYGLKHEDIGADFARFLKEIADKN